MSTAQKQEKQPLQRILLVLEQRYDIVFTYADDNITGIIISSPPENVNLTQALSFLQESTGLLFRQLNERFVIISDLEDATHIICGTVSHGDTGELITGATVRAGRNGAITNEHGYFNLGEMSPDSTLYISFIGYRTVVMPVREFADGLCKTIALQPLFTTLQTIFVNDFIAEGIDKKVDGSFGITARTLGMLPGLTEPDIMQTVQTLPGIQSVNETISDINVRGGTNDQNLLLWDGIRMYHSGHFFGLISAFNPYLTERVTIVKNGSSASTGDGVSSTIDIRTEDELSEKFSGGAGVNMINGDALARIPLSSKSSLHVSGRRSVADFFRTPAYDQYFTRAFRDSDVTNSADADSLVKGNKKFYFYDASLKWLYDLSSRDKLRLSFLNVYNDIEYLENGLINNRNISRTSGLQQHNLGSGISYSRLWNDRLRTSAQAYLSFYNLGAVNFDLQNDQRLIQENKVLDTGLKVDARVSLGDRAGLFAGYQFFETGVSNLEDINNPRFRRFVKRVIRSHAAFSEVDFTFGHTNMRLGVRGSYYPAFEKTIVEPRLSFNQNFLKDFYFEVLGEIKHQTTAQIIDLQSDFLGVEKRRWVLSNDQDIPIIRSRQVSAGVYYKKNDLLVSADVYYKHVNGIITASQGFQNQFEFIRSEGAYETVGIDLLTSKKVGRFAAWLSYSNAENTLEFNRLYPPRFAGNLDIRHRATLGGSVDMNHVEMSAGVNWHTGRPFTQPVEVINDSIKYDVANSSRLDDYMRVDFSIKYRFVIGGRIRAEMGGSVWNLLDRKNVLHEYFRLRDNGQIEAVNQYSLGLTSNVIFRIVF